MICLGLREMEREQDYKHITRQLDRVKLNCFCFFTLFIVCFLWDGNAGRFLGNMEGCTINYCSFQQFLFIVIMIKCT